jgi:hypothetical protein
MPVLEPFRWMLRASGGSEAPRLVPPSTMWPPDSRDAPAKSRASLVSLLLPSPSLSLLLLLPMSSSSSLPPAGSQAARRQGVSRDGGVVRCCQSSVA